MYALCHFLIKQCDTASDETGWSAGCDKATDGAVNALGVAYFYFFDFLAFVDISVDIIVCKKGSDDKNRYQSAQNLIAHNGIIQCKGR